MSSAFDNIVVINDKVINNRWIEWEHPGIPNESGIFRELMRMLLCIFNHCLICTKLDGCYFLERKMPELPQHNRCDCFKIERQIQQVQNIAKAECDIRKFTDYIFKGAGGKKQLFESWGYKIENSQWLKEEFENQAKKQYITGNYELKDLDISGQRISIPINLNGHYFKSGWMVYPDGKIKNTTPFGGWFNE